MKFIQYLLISFVLMVQLSVSSCSAQSEPAHARANAPAPTLHSIELSLPEDGYSQPQQRRSFVQKVLNRIKALPEVESAAISTPWQSENFKMELYKIPILILRYSAVTPDYFRVIKSELVMGRLFQEDDGPNKPGLVILSERAVRQLLRNEEPIGKRYSLLQIEKPGPWLEVVGVVADEQDLFGQAQTEIYGVYNQDPASTIRLFVRSKPGSQPVAEKLKAEIQAIDKNVTIDKVQSQ